MSPKLFTQTKSYTYTIDEYCSAAIVFSHESMRTRYYPYSRWLYAFHFSSYFYANAVWSPHWQALQPVWMAVSLVIIVQFVSCFCAKIQYKAANVRRQHTIRRQRQWHNQFLSPHTLSWMIWIAILLSTHTHTHREHPESANGLQNRSVSFTGAKLNHIYFISNIVIPQDFGFWRCCCCCWLNDLYTRGWGIFFSVQLFDADSTWRLKVVDIDLYDSSNYAHRMMDRLLGCYCYCCCVQLQHKTVDLAKRQTFEIMPKPKKIIQISNNWNWMGTIDELSLNENREMRSITILSCVFNVISFPWTTQHTRNIYKLYQIVICLLFMNAAYTWLMCISPRSICSIDDDKIAYA